MSSRDICALRQRESQLPSLWQRLQGRPVTGHRQPRQHVCLVQLPFRRCSPSPGGSQGQRGSFPRGNEAVGLRGGGGLPAVHLLCFPGAAFERETGGSEEKSHGTDSPAPKSDTAISTAALGMFPCGKGSKDRPDLFFPLGSKTFDRSGGEWRPGKGCSLARCDWDHGLPCLWL